jgi:hypothetical protein
MYAGSLGEVEEYLQPYLLSSSLLFYLLLRKTKSLDYLLLALPALSAYTVHSPPSVPPYTFRAITCDLQAL